LPDTNIYYKIIDNMKKFLIAESERERILGMHYNAMGKTLVSEQVPPSAPAATTPTTPQKQPSQASGNISVNFKNGDSVGKLAFVGPKGLQLVLQPKGNGNYSVQIAGDAFPEVEQMFYYTKDPNMSYSSISNFVRKNIQKFVDGGVMTQDSITGKQVPVSTDATTANDIAKGIINKIAAQVKA
jgi:hypothetical protein